MKQKEFKELEGLAAELRRATGLPYYVKRHRGNVNLFVTVNGEGEPTFGAKAADTVTIKSPTAIREWIDERVAGIQAGFEVVVRVAEHFHRAAQSLYTNLPGRSEAVRRASPLFMRAEFCPDCGELVYGKGKLSASGVGPMKAYDPLLYDIRERHAAETNHGS